jgi:hypothetical protein
MLKIGPIQLDAPMVQAALSGYSDTAMRRLAREYGCPYTINEVVLDKSVALGGKKMRRMLTLSADDHPVGGQLMGAEPELFSAKPRTRWSNWAMTRSTSTSAARSRRCWGDAEVDSCCRCPTRRLTF